MGSRNASKGQSVLSHSLVSGFGQASSFLPWDSVFLLEMTAGLTVCESWPNILVLQFVERLY